MLWRLGWQTFINLWIITFDYLIHGEIIDNETYNTRITGLTENTHTSYRAFIRNGVGIGYGEFKSVQTNSPVYVSITNLENTGVASNGINTYCAKINLSRPLVSGEGFCLGYTATAVSSTPTELAKPINASAHIIRNTVKCECAVSNVPSNLIDSCSEVKTDTIKINSTSNYNSTSYTICARAIGHVGNRHADYCNNGQISLTTITDICNLDVQLSYPRALYVYNTTDFCGGNGFNMGEIGFDP